VSVLASIGSDDVEDGILDSIAQGRLARDILMLMFIAVFFLPSVQTLWSLAPRYTSTAQIACIKVNECFFAPLYAFLVEGERPGPYSIAGGVLVFSAVLCHSIAAVYMLPLEVEERGKSKDAPSSWGAVEGETCTVPCTAAQGDLPGSRVVPVAASDSLPPAKSGSSQYAEPEVPRSFCWGTFFEMPYLVLQCLPMKLLRRSSWGGSDGSPMTA